MAPPGKHLKLGHTKVDFSRGAALRKSTQHALANRLASSRYLMVKPTITLRSILAGCGRLIPGVLLPPLSRAICRRGNVGPTVGR